MNLNFTDFNTGSLFLVRTPDTFPVGYAEKSFCDMKNNLHFNYAALLETWNCYDGVLWKSDKFPRSSYWKGEERDPIEECFLAADKYDMAFLPEAGVMHEEFMNQHQDGMLTKYNGEKLRYGRTGLTPSCPITLEYLIDKYDTLLEKFMHHKSCAGICMPCENTVELTYDKYTLEAYRKTFGENMPTPEEIYQSKATEEKVFRFLEECFLNMYRKLAKYLKKYNLPLMHYPIDKISSDSFFQPTGINPSRNITIMKQVRELDMLNMQLHPPLYPNPYYFKMETEYLMANAQGKPCMTDTHFYHESAAGRLPDTTPKRIIDNILSSLTPNGISFFCYGFMAEELPLWKKELNPNAPVYKAYQEENTLKARRKMCLKSMDFVEVLRPLMEGTKHRADCALYFPESLCDDYMYSSYATEHAFGLHEAFNAASVPFTISASIPKNSEEQKLLILDSVKTISDTDLKSLENYLANDGKIVIIGKCCEGIEKLAGIKTELTDARFIKSDKSENYNHCYIRLPLDGKHYTEKNAEALLYYDNGLPAVTQKGNILYFGASDEIGRFSALRDFGLAYLIKEYCIRENLASGVEFYNKYVGMDNRHQFTSCDIFENSDKKLLLVRNFGVEQHHSKIKWNIPNDFKITKAFADGKEFEFKNNAELPMFEHFIAILAEN